MARTYRFVVGSKEASLRLDRYLVRHLPQTLSRALIQDAIREGVVTVEGRVAKAHRRLKKEETIIARFDTLPQPSTDAVMLPEPIPLEVVYEDAELLVVNKPPGLVTHPAPGHWSGTLVHAILWHLQQAQGSRLRARGTCPEPTAQNPEPSLPRAGIVHRLDKDTSGLLLVAKTQHALRALAKQLKARTLGRRYVALVKGHVGFDEGTIDAALGRHMKDRKLQTVRYLGGRQAVTHYRVLKRLEAQDSPARLELSPGRAGLGALAQSPPRPVSRSESRDEQPRTHSPERFLYTLLEVWLETGRTHQVRVHLAHLGHPVLGDSVYSRHPASHWSALGIPRQLLHAYAIRFVHPTRHELVELKASLPEDIRRWIPPDSSIEIGFQ